jgi:hypothetical protein
MAFHFEICYQLIIIETGNWKLETGLCLSANLAHPPRALVVVYGSLGTLKLMRALPSECPARLGRGLGRCAAIGVRYARLPNVVQLGPNMASASCPPDKLHYFSHPDWSCLANSSPPLMQFMQLSNLVVEESDARNYPFSSSPKIFSSLVVILQMCPRDPDGEYLKESLNGNTLLTPP